MYLDHAGDLTFFGQQGEERRRGLVICAVLVPDASRADVLGLLPRDPSDGSYLKAASRTTTDEAVATFARSLLQHDVDISVVSLDVDDAGNAINIEHAARYANYNRGKLNKPPLSKIDAAYWLFYPKAVVYAWGKCSERRGRKVRRIRIVFDSEQIQEAIAREIVESLQEPFSDKGVEVEDVDWRSEQDEPMLYAPDLLAGARLRQYRCRDCPLTHAVLVGASNSGRIAMPREIEILTLPSTEELDAMGA